MEDRAYLGFLLSKQLQKFWKFRLHSGWTLMESHTEVKEHLLSTTRSKSR